MWIKLRLTSKQLFCSKLFLVCFMSAVGGVPAVLGGSQLHEEDDEDEEVAMLERCSSAHGGSEAPNLGSIRHRFHIKACAMDDRDSRVTAYTMGGTQCCLPALGSAADNTRLTFPSCFLVKDSIGRPWIRNATEQELQESPRWWRELTHDKRDSSTDERNKTFVPAAIHDTGDGSTDDRDKNFVLPAIQHTGGGSTDDRKKIFIPQAIVHSTDQTASPEDAMGMFGSSVVVLPYKSMHEKRYVDIKPNIDLSQIHTPPSMSDEEF